MRRFANGSCRFGRLPEGAKERQRGELKCIGQATWTWKRRPVPDLDLILLRPNLHVRLLLLGLHATGLSPAILGPRHSQKLTAEALKTVPTDLVSV